MKKVLLILMLVVLSSLSFAARGDKGSGADFYTLYKSANSALESPEVHDKIGLEKEEVKEVRDLINKGWYEIKVLEAEKLKEIFAIDKIFIDGNSKKGKVDKHFENIRKINDKMEKIYRETKEKCENHMDLSKLK